MPESTPLTFPRSFSARRALRPLGWGVGVALVLAVATLSGEGLGTLHGAIVGLYAANQPELVAVLTGDDQCDKDTDAQLKPGNPDGYRLSQGEGGLYKTVNDPAAHTFLRDKGRAMARCLLNNPSTSTSARSNLMVSVWLNMATINGTVLPALPAAQQAEDTAMIAQVQARADAALERNVLTKAVLAYQIRALCSGLAGQVRCVPVRIASVFAAGGEASATWGDRWAAFLHPDRLAITVANGDVNVATRVDAGLWKLNHPDAMLNYNAMLINDGVLAAVTSNLDPTPSPGALRAKRQDQADAIFNGYEARMKAMNNLWADPFQDWH